MIDQGPQKLEYYFRHSRDSVKQALLSLRDIDRSLFEDSEMAQKFGTYVDFLTARIEAPREEGPQWPIDMACISIIDVDIISEFTRNPRDTDVRDVLFFQLELVAGTTVYGEISETYTPEQISKILTGEMKDYNPVWFAYTLRQAIIGYDVHKYREVIWPYIELEQVISRREYSWEEAFYFSLMLQNAWCFFPVLTEEQQVFLLSFYFYRSIVAGVPVKEYLSNSLYESAGIFDLLFFHALYTGALDQNVEAVTTDIMTDVTKPLNDIVNNYINRVGEDILDGFKQNEFVQALYEGQKGRDPFVSWIQESFFIILHLKRGNLIDQASFEEVTELNKMHEDFVTLLTWFFDEKRWQNLVDYFQKVDSHVQLKVFLWYCTYIYDLETDGSVQKFVNFTEFLQENRLLREDEDIIEYHEEDKQFHWNEALLAS